MRMSEVSAAQNQNAEGPHEARTTLPLLVKVILYKVLSKRRGLVIICSHEIMCSH